MKHFSVLMVALLSLPLIALADQVELTNDDTISGKVE